MIEILKYSQLNVVISKKVEVENKGSFKMKSLVEHKM